MGWRNLFGNRRDRPAAAAAGPTQAAAASAPGAEADPLDQLAALRGLAARAGAAAAAELEALLRCEWRTLRIAAAEEMSALAHAGGQGFAVVDIGEIPPEALARRREIAAGLADDRVRRLVDSLGHDDPLVRLAAAEVLGETGRPEAARALLGALRDADWTVVSQANESLCTLGAAAIPILVEARPGSDESVRASIDWCLDMLSRNPDPPVAASATAAVRQA